MNGLILLLALCAWVCLRLVWAATHLKRGPDGDLHGEFKIDTIECVVLAVLFFASVLTMAYDLFTYLSRLP